MSIDEGLRAEMDGLERLLGTLDAVEGVTAFVEKRRPRFLGK
jgi:enoyl-CoA hydratase/carnithine racemase